MSSAPHESSGPLALQYASTPYGYYRKIGGAFTVGKVKWLGPVIASPEAIYLLKVARQNSGAMAGAAAGGLIGGLIAGAISAAMQKPDETRSCTYFQIPDEVRSHPDWPVKKQKKDVDVIVLSKPYVPVIRHPRFTNMLKLEAAGLNYAIEYTLFRGGKVKAFLAEAGWKLEW